MAFDWGEKQEKAFQTLKRALCTALILSLPEGIEDFVVYCDASNQGLGWSNHEFTTVNSLVYDSKLSKVVQGP